MLFYWIISLEFTNMFHKLKFTLMLDWHSAAGTALQILLLECPGSAAYCWKMQKHSKTHIRAAIGGAVQENIVFSLTGISRNEAFSLTWAFEISNNRDRVLNHSKRKFLKSTCVWEERWLGTSKSFYHGLKRKCSSASTMQSGHDFNPRRELCSRKLPFSNIKNYTKVMKIQELKALIYKYLLLSLL